jgi:hypothetical protein
MATETMDRINELTAERAELFRTAGAGRSGDRTIMTRVHEIDSELEELWELRRRERIGTLEGIDLVIEQEYERIYGKDFRPIPVAEPDDHKKRVAA